MSLFALLLIIGAVAILLGIVGTIINVVLYATRPRRTIVIWYDDDDDA